MKRQSVKKKEDPIVDRKLCLVGLMAEVKDVKITESGDKRHLKKLKHRPKD